MIKLKQLILEGSNYDLQTQIEKYIQMSKKIQLQKKEIEEQLNKISKLEKQTKTSFKKIQQYMQKNNVYQKKANDWVAKLSEVAAYKRIQPDYKQIYTIALTKLNPSTRNVLVSLQQANIQLKRQATKIQLSIVQQGVFDFIKSIINKFKKVITNIKSRIKIINSLPKIK